MLALSSFSSSSWGRIITSRLSVDSGGVVRSRFPVARAAHNNPRKFFSSGTQKPFSFLEWYSLKLDTHPLTTKCLTSGLIAGAGDLSCQWLTVDSNEANNEFSWDMARTGRFALLGTVLVGPCIHAWYGWLAQKFGNQTLIRVALDQLVFTPAFLSVWMSSLWALQGDREDLWSRLVRELPTTVVANWMLWVPAQTVNFRFVPIKFQVLFSNVVALLWNCYLSFTQASSRPTQSALQDSLESKNGEP